jgi:hypothetical protein
MHEGVEIWEDCCVCEAEPRWQKLAEQLEEEKNAKESSEQPPWRPPTMTDDTQSPFAETARLHASE